MKLLSVITIAALSAFAIPATAAAQDAAPCPEGFAPVESVGGPLCVNPIYLDGTWHDHPSECGHGFYQGSCAPDPAPSPVLPVEAYTFQMDNPTPAYVAEVVAKQTVWLSVVDLALADLRGPR